MLAASHFHGRASYQASWTCERGLMQPRTNRCAHVVRPSVADHASGIGLPDRQQRTSLVFHMCLSNIVLASFQVDSRRHDLCRASLTCRHLSRVISCACLCLCTKLLFFHAITHSRAPVVRSSATDHATAIVLTDRHLRICLVFSHLLVEHRISI